MAPNTSRARGRDPFQKKNIEQFLNAKKPNTAKAYRTGLVKYLAWIYREEEAVKDGNRIDLTHYNALSEQYLQDYTTPDEHAALLTDFIEDLKAAHAPKMLAVMKGAVIQYLAANKVFLPPQQAMSIKTGNRPVTVDRIPIQEEIRAILSHGDLASRTYVLMLLSSGMRPGEPLGLTWDDVDLERGMVSIPAAVTKTGVARVTFLSKEALELFKEWRDYFPEYCVKVEQQTAGTVIPDRNRIFPATYRSMHNRFALMLKKAGFNDEQDTRTGRRAIHLHGFRKYFRTHLAKGGNGNAVDAIEVLMGHDGYLNAAYVRLTTEDLEEFYRENEHLLWIYKERPHNEAELRMVQRENAALRDELNQVQQQISMMNVMQADINANPEALQQLVDGRIKALMGERGESDLGKPI